MLTNEDLKAISDLMDIKLEPLKNDISEMKTDIDEMKESLEEVRGAQNEVLKWFDKWHRKDFDRPFPVKNDDENEESAS